MEDHVASASVTLVGVRNDQRRRTTASEAVTIRAKPHGPWPGRSMTLTPIVRANWTKIIARLSSRAGPVAKLLANEMPDNIAASAIASRAQREEPFRTASGKAGSARRRPSTANARGMVRANRER